VDRNKAPGCRYLPFANGARTNEISQKGNACNTCIRVATCCLVLVGACCYMFLCVALFCHISYCRTSSHVQPNQDFHPKNAQTRTHTNNYSKNSSPTRVCQPSVFESVARHNARRTLPSLRSFALLCICFLGGLGTQQGRGDPRPAPIRSQIGPRPGAPERPGDLRGHPPAPAPDGRPPRQGRRLGDESRGPFKELRYSPSVEAGPESGDPTKEAFNIVVESPVGRLNVTLFRDHRFRVLVWGTVRYELLMLECLQYHYMSIV